ncbi:ShlB/FhaC/HecB family hemolysin secretion/activation protein [Sphingomonas qomolangmaensis]|uniref:ShlB/FhaC/HecB family hemolysin secretion/activation protein n=1 Tax=Sphingomonas qomolangmaensis TaxID=2918765 RepID=A0ABY5L9V2_9SPHN|nr:ShlB/FhaC/HecB family hemolysin secretion/activation protein [Sphingomonas qomolangmaensis]UUL83547.1 ShlB/FhaC/HecB family hemolysin secretion/activation protein [Sphingomonas qomolangmaensis]
MTCSTAAIAQSIGAGQQLQQIPPAPLIPKATPDIDLQPRVPAPQPEVSGEAIRIDALRITGATLFPPETLLAASGFVPGSTLTLGEMRSVAGRISAYYQARGYFLAQAYIPEQDVQSGTVTVAVIEGQYGKIDVNNTSRVSDGVVQSRLRGLNSGDIVTGAPLERRLLLLSDLPGVGVRSTLSPGTAVGTSDLLVDVTPGRSISGSIEADNAGNRYTGEYRGGGTINLANPLGIGDLLSARILASSGGLAYGRLAYQLPVGDLTLGASYAHIRYELGREFERLDADGAADIASLYARYPVIRSRDLNVYLTGALDAKWFEDRIGLVSTQSNRNSRIASLGIDADGRDDFAGGGISSVSARLSYGDLNILNADERAIDGRAGRTQGGFGKLDFAAARLQTISGPLSLYTSVRGQYAFDNLDTSEKMQLGGAYGVRAYPEGEAFGDQGVIVTAEARLGLSDLIAFDAVDLQAFGFIDAGVVDFAHDPYFAGPNRSSRSGIGAGLSAGLPGGLILRGTYAHRLGDQRVTSGPDRAGRFWFQIVKLF